MSRGYQQKRRRRLDAESGTVPPPWGGRLSVALVFPNTYHQGMSNLGFQTVYHLLNQDPRTRCERFFLPDHEDLEDFESGRMQLCSLETDRPLHTFDLVAFSLSFENDYLNLPLLFRAGGLPLRREDRGDTDPLVIAGGVCAFLNPEPIADFFDLFVVGEAEPLLPPLLDHLLAQKEERKSILRSLGKLPGFYIPELVTPQYDEAGVLQGWVDESGHLPVRRVWASDIGTTESRTFVYTPETEFSGMALTEISRGCSRGCRFCAAGYIYLPVRERTPDDLASALREGAAQCQKIGLVGAAVSDYPDLERLHAMISDLGAGASVSSLRIDSLTPQEIASLYADGHRTVALAPEAGSQRMRDCINKGITLDQIVDAARMLGEGGMLNLKLYYLIGLPGEDEHDVEEIVTTSRAVRDAWLTGAKQHGRAGTVTLSVNPFIPKPFTPFQWAPMASAKVLEKRLNLLKRAVGREANLRMIAESVRGVQVQGVFSRGDRRISLLIEEMASGTSLKGACRALEISADFYLERERGEGEHLPWEVIDSGVRRAYLYREYQNALAGRLTPPCSGGCSRCGICN